MYIGYMGDVVFTVSSDYLLTPSEFQRSGESRWTEHDLILRKPVSQFKGPGLEKVTFKIHLRADHNISPDTQLKKLRQMRDTGAVFPLIIGGSPVTQNYWRLVSLSEEPNYYGPTGKLLQSTANVTLEEYDDSNYTEENTIVNKYGTMYNTVASLMGGL